MNTAIDSLVGTKFPRTIRRRPNPISFNVCCRITQALIMNALAFTSPPAGSRWDRFEDAHQQRVLPHFIPGCRQEICLSERSCKVIIGPIMHAQDVSWAYWGYIARSLTLI